MKWVINSEGPDQIEFARGDESFYARYDDVVTGTKEGRRKVLVAILSLLNENMKESMSTKTNLTHNEWVARVTTSTIVSVNTKTRAEAEKKIRAGEIQIITNEDIKVEGLAWHTRDKSEE